MTFRDFLQRERIPFRQSSTHSEEILLKCPFCPERGNPGDTRFLLSINVASGAGHCWHVGCGFKSRHAISLTMKKLHLRPYEDIDELETIAPKKTSEPVCLPGDFLPLDQPPNEDLDQTALNYVLSRGVTQAQIHKKHIGVSYQGRYAYRILFPVYSNQKLVGIVARDFTDTRVPKYLNSPGEKWLYNFNPLAETVVLAEGVIKALRLEQVCGHNCCALLGHSVTETQLTQLRDSKCRQIILFPDPDRAGREGFVKVADKLSEELHHADVHVVWPVEQPADEAPLEKLGLTINLARRYNMKINLALLGGL